MQIAPAYGSGRNAKIMAPCTDCGTERWVQFVISTGLPRSVRCRACSSRRNTQLKPNEGHPNWRGGLSREPHYARDYQRVHSDACQVRDATARAKAAGAEGSFTIEEWVQLKDCCHQTCARCHLQMKLTVDHIVPLSLGGSNYITNIQPLCKPCNTAKEIEEGTWRAKGTRRKE